MNPFLQTQTSLLQHILVYTYIYNNLAPTIWSLISRIGWVVPWWVLPNAMRNSQFEKLHNFSRHRFLKDQMIKMLCHYWILLIPPKLATWFFFFLISFFESELSLIFNTLLEEKSNYSAIELNYPNTLLEKKYGSPRTPSHVLTTQKKWS